MKNAQSLAGVPGIRVFSITGSQVQAGPSQGLDTVEKFKHAHPEVEVHVYPADHGFNCDHRGAYQEASAKMALQRTLAFFAKHVG